MADNKTEASPFVGDAPYLCLMRRNFWGGCVGKKHWLFVPNSQCFAFKESEREQTLECVSDKLLFLCGSCLLDFGFCDSVMR